MIFKPEIVNFYILKYEMMKGLNTKEKIQFLCSMTKYSFSHPECAIELIKTTNDFRNDRKRPVHNYTNYSTDIKDILDQLFPNMDVPKYDLSQLNIHCEQFLQKLDSEEHPSKNKPYPTFYSLDHVNASLLYLICKILKPEKVVETGVAYGSSCSYILQALHENNYGKLYSIDYSFRPWESKQMIGSMIPDYLRSRWNLVYGIASKKLKPLLDSLGQIDIFIHDSAHSYNNMMFEYNTSWPFIKKDGLLISDDVNNAFHDFSTQKNIPPILYSEKTRGEVFFGILQK